MGGIKKQKLLTEKTAKKFPKISGFTDFTFAKKPTWGTLKGIPLPGPFAESVPHKVLHCLAPKYSMQGSSSHEKEFLKCIVFTVTKVPMPSPHPSYATTL